MLASSNIPVEKVPHIRPFLVKYCKQGGSCPTTVEGLRKYASAIYEDHRAIIGKKSLENRSH
jgi:hypothetical protein